MKVITVLFSIMLFVASSFGGYSYTRENRAANAAMEMDCDKSCCKKTNQQQKSSEDKKQGCCNNDICSPLSSCNYVLISYPSHQLKSFGVEASKPPMQTQSFILNKFINVIFQPPEFKLLS